MTEFPFSMPRALAALFTLALLWLSVPANAQYEPCPGGRQVGEEQMIGFVMPICHYDAPSAETATAPAPAPAATPQYWHQSRGAVAFHPAARDVWATGWSRKDSKTVEADTLARCNAVMGGGCFIASSALGGAFSVGRGEDGLLRVGWGDTPKKAEASLKTLCAQDITNCAFVHKMIGNGQFLEYAFTAANKKDFSQTYAPPAAMLTGQFALVAIPADDIASGASAARAWLASGERNPQQAFQRAAQRCANESGRPCNMLTSAVNSALFNFRDATGKVHWSAAFDAKGAAARMQRICKQRLKSKCTMGQLFDTATPRDQMVTFVP